MIDILKESYTYRAVRKIINQSLEVIGIYGEMVINFFYALKYIIRCNLNLRITLEQLSRFGIDSLPLSLSMVTVSGMIIALQLALEMMKQGAGNYVGALVAVSIVRELGPIMGSFAVIAMAGSSMAAEVGTMKVTEQVDAMKVLKVDPICYMVAPRVIAGFIIMPFVIVLANVTGIVGGMIVSNLVAELSPLSYIDSVWRGLSVRDVYISLFKGSIFGIIISLICTTLGYRVKRKGGAREVGKATTKAVVWSFITVVIVDYVMSYLLWD